MFIILTLLFLYFGLCIFYLFYVDRSIFEDIGTSFLLGFGIMTMVVFLYSLFDLKIDRNSVFASVSLLIVVVRFLLNSKIYIERILLNKIQKLRLIKSLSKTEILYIILIGLTFVASFTISAYWPVHSWDSLALYDFRAKLIVDKGLFMQVASDYNYILNYPLMTSILHVFVYLFGLGNPQFIYSLFFISFSLVFYSLLRRSCARHISLLCTLLLVSTPIFFNHSTFAYTNLPFTVYFALGTLYLYLSFVEKKQSLLILSSVMIGLSCWVRHTEPFWLSTIPFVFYYSYKFKKVLYPLLYLVILFIFQEPWKYLLRSISSLNYALAPSQVVYNFTFLKNFSINSIFDVVVYLYHYTMLPWLNSYILFIIALMASFLSRWRDNFFLYFIIVNYIILIMGTYIFSLRYQYWRDIPDSATRMVMFFVPLFIFYLAHKLEDRKIFL